MCLPQIWCASDALPARKPRIRYFQELLYSVIESSFLVLTSLSYCFPVALAHIIGNGSSSKPISIPDQIKRRRISRRKIWNGRKERKGWIFAGKWAYTYIVSTLQLVLLSLGCEFTQFACLVSMPAINWVIIPSGQYFSPIPVPFQNRLIEQFALLMNSNTAFQWGLL